MTLVRCTVRYGCYIRGGPRKRTCFHTATIVFRTKRTDVIYLYCPPKHLDTKCILLHQRTPSMHGHYSEIGSSSAVDYALAVAGALEDGTPLVPDVAVVAGIDFAVGVFVAGAGVSLKSSALISPRFFSHHSASTFFSSSMISSCFLRAELALISFAVWKMIWPQFGVSALACALLAHFFHSRQTYTYLHNNISELVLHLLLCSHESLPQVITDAAARE